MDINDQKEAFSEAYVRAIASVAKYDCSSPEHDRDSIDIIFRSQVEPYVSIESQLKATSISDIITGDSICFPLKIKNYNDLRGRSVSPRILIVLILPSKIEEEDLPEKWIDQSVERLILMKCAYWISLKDMPESKNTTSVSIKIPMDKYHIFSPEALKDLGNRAANNRMSMS
jgi:hypothetical protein